MKVSLIVPFWQGMDFLMDCLESIKEESCNHYEYELETILVLDHPKEELTTILCQYQYAISMRVVELEEETGVSAARNKGLEYATGEFVYFLDSDDYLYDGTIGRLLETAKENPEADVVYGKKVTTWYKRDIFISTNADLEEDEENETDMEQEEETEEGDSHKELDPDALTPDRSTVYHRMITKKRGIRSISALNMLIHKSLLLEHDIRFQEEILYYADLSFVIQVLAYSKAFARNPEAYYIKRKHNDPVQHPAISQMQHPQRFQEYLDAYQYACSVIPKEDEELLIRLQRKWVNYYTKFFVTRVRRAKENYWREERYQQMREIALTMKPEVYREMSHYKRKHLKALRDGDLVKTQKLTRNYLAKKKLVRIIKRKRTRYRMLYSRVFMKMPMIDNLVVFESFLGRNYSDSCKYIYRYLRDAYPDEYRFVWIRDKNVKLKIDGKAKIVRRFSLAYFYYLARAKYWVNNMRQPNWLQKREGTIMLETWHGTPLKKLVFDMEDVYSANPKYKKQFYKQSRKWDYLISDNAFSTKVFQSAFLFECEKILELGYPRNDLLYEDNREELSVSIRQQLGIPFDKKTILYAPTWRDDEFYQPGQYKFQLKLDLHKMREYLGEEYVVLLRTHYFIADHLDVDGLDGFAYNVSDYPDITELYLISDVCITDYSSVFFDYANLKRPMLFFTYDLEKYRDMLRGFYIDIESDLPGPLLYTTEEVIHAIQNIEGVTEKYAEKYKKFYEKFCSLDDGEAAKRVVERVFRGQK
ncbi:MAG: CDP-glycerol glycerophosphotransferase family protein [Lachnospiraceae bacterium]